jgi:hypothetical protein
MTAIRCYIVVRRCSEVREYFRLARLHTVGAYVDWPGPDVKIGILIGIGQAFPARVSLFVT